MASSRHSGVGAALLALGLATPLAAQGLRVSGSVVRVTERDTLPLAGAWAVLHEVTLAGGGPADSARTDGRGRYRLEAAARDTAARFVVSVRHDGIAYFTEPLRFPAARRDTAEVLAVYDTSSAAPPIRLAQRHLIVREPAADGSRRVIELLVLENRGRRTRIAPDSTRPVWRGALPAGALQFEVGESDLSDLAVRRWGDTIAVLAPIPPGARELLVSYIVPSPARRLAIPFDQDVDRVNLLLEDTSAVVDSGPLTLAGLETLERLVALRYMGEHVAAGTVVSVAFSAAPFRWQTLSGILAALAALAMGVVLLRWWRAGARPAVAPADAETLAARIAALDAEFEGRETDEYRRRRAELKQQLSEALKDRER